VSKIIPPTTAEPTVAPVMNNMPPVEVNTKEPVMKTFRKDCISTGKYPAQVAGTPGSVRDAKGMVCITFSPYVHHTVDASTNRLLASLVPSATQTI
jgi:hypothetical protein